VGLLFPEDVPVEGLPASERRVVREFQSTLSDNWLIIPRLDLINERRPYEVDILLINELLGVVAIEVKGGPFTIRKGQWYRRDEIVDPSPPRQAQDAAYELRNQLRGYSPLLERIHVQPAVALPDLRDLGDLADRLPPGVDRAQLLFLDDLTASEGGLEDRLWELVGTNVHNRPLAADQVEGVLGFLRPDVYFCWDPQAQAEYARAALNRISIAQTGALATLDLNRSVVVDGGAGSGKTRLALAWAQRAIQRGERTLLTCYNDPISEWLGEMSPRHHLLTVGPFLRTLLALGGLPPLGEPPDPNEDNEEWWATEPFRHLVEHFGELTDRFDTIVIDEAQDFSPEWIDLAERLLVDDKVGRLLRVVDPDQSIYGRGFELPLPGSDLVRASLTVNCRNTRSVVDVLRRFGGSPAAPGAPQGEPVEFIGCSSPDEAVAVVGEVLGGFVGDSYIEPANILICTADTDRKAQRDLRDLIRGESPGGFSCVGWEDRLGGHIVCETVHRSKGLERDAVVFATLDDDLDEILAYVGMSRAISRLVVVGPPAFNRRFGGLGHWGP